MNADPPTTRDYAALAGMERLIEAMKGIRPAPPPSDDEAKANAATRETGPPSFDTSDLRRLRAALEPTSPLECGAVIGRHMVLRRLGAGAMGVVYAAYDPELDRKVALKVLLPNVTEDAGGARLRREAQALGKLAHPNVVTVHDMGIVGDQVWLAMELVEGQTLRQWLSTPRGWREVLEVMRDAGKGLAAAHAAGLLHRDFKPDNVMIGDDGRVRVMDFGLARAHSEQVSLETGRSQPLETSTLRLTQAGTIHLVWVVGLRRTRHELGLQWGKTAMAFAKWRRAEPQMEARALYMVGSVLDDQGTPEQALEHLRQALAIEEDTLGSLHPAVAGTRNAIGSVLLDQGKLDDALPYLESALTIKEEALGPQHPSVASSLTNIGSVLQAQGKREEALSYHQRALTVSQGAYGPSHPHVAISLNSIGAVLTDLGKLDEALSHHQRALAIQQESLGSPHPSIADSFDSIGIALAAKGDLRGALGYHQRSLATREEALGSNHPDVWISLNNLGNVLLDLGELESALAHHQRALAIREEAEGPRHVDVGGSLTNIGSVLARQGKAEEALLHHQRALEIFEESLGPRHLHVGGSLAGIGHLLLEQGRLDDARTHYQRALAISEEAFGPRDHRIAGPLLGLAKVELARREFDTARTHAERALEILQSAQVSPFELAGAKYTLARALWPDRSQRDHARALAEQARDACAETGAIEHLVEVEAWLAEHGGRAEPVSRDQNPPASRHASNNSP